MIPAVEQWLAQMVADTQPQAPVLEVGAYDVNGSARRFFPTPYTGIDMRQGPGVDEVRDILTDPPLPDDSYGAIVCCETLEHMVDPQRGLVRMYRMLTPNGQVYLTAPFAWPEHNEPSDYWRFTPQGLRLLLENAGFVDVVTDWGNNRSHAFGYGRKA